MSEVIVKKVKSKNSNTPWADLPHELLCCITTHLCYVEQIYFRAVCKNWGLVSGIKPKDKLPWVLTLNFHCNHRAHRSTLTDPSTLKSYDIGHLIVQSNWQGAGTLQVCGARNGWVLIAEIPPMVYYDWDFVDFYLYNPFNSEETVSLPGLKSQTFRATFTSNPISPDCLFFAIHDDHGRSRLMCISTCHRGDKQWTECLAVEGDAREVIGVVYIKAKGMFYCVFRSGMVGSFDPTIKNWTIVTSQNMDSSELQGIGYGFEPRVVETDGEVLLVYSNRNCKPWHIFRLDWLKMTWVKEVRLGKRMIFIGDVSFVIPANGEIEDLADRIYYHGFMKSYYYPVKSGIGPLKSNSLQRRTCKHYESRSPYMLRVWIEPPMMP